MPQCRQTGVIHLPPERVDLTTMTTNVSAAPQRWSITVTRRREVEEEMIYVGTMPTAEELELNQSPLDWIRANYQQEGDVEQRWTESWEDSVELEPTLLVELLDADGEVISTEEVG